MPGLIAAPTSASAKAVGEKFRDVVTKHNEHLDDIEDLHKAAQDDVVDTVLHSVGLSEDTRAEKHVRHFLDSRATLFRFYRRSRYSVATALDMLTTTLSWRLRTDLDSLSLASLHPLYTSPPARPPLFWASTGCSDRFGRPIGVISLQSLERVTHDDGTAGLDECREYIVGCMESMRRYLVALYDAALDEGKHSQAIDLDEVDRGAQDGSSSSRPKQPLQMVIIFSLQSSGMANLELELLPFLLDLLKNHYPGMVGAVYIMHFGWVHSGMWALAKRILPQQALARIFFPKEKEMEDHFPLECLPACFGGTMDVELNDDTNDVMQKFANSRWTRNKQLVRKGKTPELPTDSADETQTEDEVMSAPPSPRGLSGTSTPRAGVSSAAMSRGKRTHSRAGSFDSLVDEFYSLANSPAHSRSATPRTSRPTTPHVEHPSFLMSRANEVSRPGFKTPEATAGLSREDALRITPSAASKLRHLQMIRGESSQSRSRANSENTTMPSAASSSSVSPVERMSPVISRPTSPNHSRRRTLTVPSARPLRNVHFKGSDSSETSGLGINVEGDSVRPIHRVGSLRDFRLSSADLARDLTDPVTGHDSSSDESEKSGKAGETASQAKQSKEASAGGFFARFRRSPRMAGSTLEASSTASAAQDKGKAAADRSEDEDAESLLALSPEPRAPDSPRLQVPDIEEPPLAETSRFFSRRSRKYGNLPGHVSPYNASNPFYGYPALPESGSAGTFRLDAGPSRIRDGEAAAVASLSNDPRRRYRFRRRKRDLIRTLVYLFVLRLLAMHRSVRAVLLASYRGTMHAITIGGIVSGRNAIADDDASAATSTLQQQHERYERLRNAGTRFNMAAPNETEKNTTGETSQRGHRRKASYHQPRQPQPQPLVALGMRKRYIILSLVVMFLLLRRYEWRRRRTW